MDELTLSFDEPSWDLKSFLLRWVSAAPARSEDRTSKSVNRVGAFEVIPRPSYRLSGTLSPMLLPWGFDQRIPSRQRSSPTHWPIHILTIVSMPDASHSAKRLKIFAAASKRCGLGSRQMSATSMNSALTPIFTPLADHHQQNSDTISYRSS